MSAEASEASAGEDRAQPEGLDAPRDRAELVRRLYAGKLLPADQVGTLRDLDVFPTRVIRRGGQVADLQRAPAVLGDFPIHAGGQVFDLYDYVSRNRVAGLLILKDGKVALERYELGMGPSTRWMSMSMAKSVATTLVGAAIQDGVIGSAEEPLVRYLPELKGSAYDGVSVRELLQMTSGAGWDDTHTDPGSERSRMLELQIAQRPGAILDYMKTLPRVAAPGSLWNYSTGETHVVGALIRAATGLWLSDYLSERIWSRLGMEDDACWWLESPGGLEVAGSGISATLRDYARFGLFVMGGGVIGGERILPEGWVEEAGAPRQLGGERLDYGYMWWPVAGPDGVHEGAFSARGIFGQYLYLNPRHRLVVAVLSARSKPKGAEAVLDNDFFNAVVQACE